jgi:hypothetical protein
LATGDPDATPYVPVGLYDLTSNDGTVAIDKTNRYIYDLSATGGGGGSGYSLKYEAHNWTGTLDQVVAGQNLSNAVLTCSSIPAVSGYVYWQDGVYLMNVFQGDTQYGVHTMDCYT